MKSLLRVRSNTRWGAAEGKQSLTWRCNCRTDVTDVTEVSISASDISDTIWPNVRFSFYPSVSYDVDHVERPQPKSL